MRDILLWSVALVALILALLLTPQGGRAHTPCYEDQTCWDGRTMGNQITGERWLGHNGADQWTPDRINWYVHVKWGGIVAPDAQMVHTT